MSPEEYTNLQEELNAIFGKLGATENQLDAVTKKFGEDSVGLIDDQLSEAFEDATQALELLNSIQVVPEAPELEIPEIEGPAVEEPVTS